MIDLEFVICTNGKKIKDLYRLVKSIQNSTDNKFNIHVGGVVDNFKDFETQNNIFLHNFSDAAKNGYVGRLRNQLIEKTQSNIVVCCDDDMLIPEDWFKKFIDYNEKNKDWNFLTNKIYIPNGGRYWDRAIIDDNMHTMVDYNHNKKDNRLTFCGTFFIIKKNCFLKNKFNPNLKIYGGNLDKNNSSKTWMLAEEPELSKRLYENGFVIDFDENNYVFHISNDFTQVVRSSNNSYNVVVKNDLLKWEQDTTIKIKNKDIILLLRDEIKKLI